MKIVISFLLAAALASFAQAPKQNPPASATERMYRSAADSAQRKFDHISTNGSKAKPDQTPTVFSEREINSYFQAGRVQFPTGVRSVQFVGQSGVLKTTAVIDFDQITAKQQSQNPLLQLFSGVHDVHVTSRAQASGGRATVHTDAVDIDGIPVPRMALQYFLDKYVRPKHPEVGLDSTFTLPYKIDIARVGDHQLTITQK